MGSQNQIALFAPPQFDRHLSGSTGSFRFLISGPRRLNKYCHASHLLRAGIHPKIVSERLGHSSVGITLDTYSHVLPGMQEDAVRLLDAALTMAMKKNKADKA